MASGSGWRGAYNRNAKARRSRYARLRTARVRGNVNGNRRYTRQDALPF